MTRKKEKMPKCNHSWSEPMFDDYDIAHISRHDDAADYPWHFQVDDACLLCQKKRSRVATSDEVRAVRAKHVCARCGEGAHEGIDCVELLLSRVKDLERRMDKIDEWKRS